MSAYWLTSYACLAFKAKHMHRYLLTSKFWKAKCSFSIWIWSFSQASTPHLSKFGPLHLLYNYSTMTSWVELMFTGRGIPKGNYWCHSTKWFRRNPLNHLIGDQISYCWAYANIWNSSYNQKQTYLYDITNDMVDCKF